MGDSKMNKKPVVTPIPTNIHKKTLKQHHNHSIFIKIEQKVEQKQNEGCWDAIKACFKSKP